MLKLIKWDFEIVNAKIFSILDKNALRTKALFFFGINNNNDYLKKQKQTRNISFNF